MRAHFFQTADERALGLLNPRRVVRWLYLARFSVAASVYAAAIFAWGDPELIEKTKRCLAHLAALSSVEFQFSYGESMAFHLPQWVGREEIESFLGQVEPQAFGDVYIRERA